MAKIQTYVAEYMEAYRSKIKSDFFVGTVYPDLLTGEKVRYHHATPRPQRWQT